MFLQLKITGNNLVVINTCLQKFKVFMVSWAAQIVKTKSVLDFHRFPKHPTGFVSFCLSFQIFYISLCVDKNSKVRYSFILFIKVLYK